MIFQMLKHLLIEIQFIYFGNWFFVFLAAHVMCQVGNRFGGLQPSCHFQSD